MADVNITITVPDQWVSRTLEALNGLANETIVVIRGDGIVRYNYAEKDDGENNIQFAKRAFTDMIKRHIIAYELNKDFERYQTDIDGLTLPNTDVPEDILT